MTNKKQKTKLLLVKTFIIVFCSVCVFLTVYPLWVLFVGTTRSSAQIVSGISLIPSNHFFLNLKNIFKIADTGMNIFVALKNSLFIAVTSTAISVYSGALTAYGLVAYQFRLRRFITNLIIALMMIPGIFTMVGGFLFWYSIRLVNTFIPFTIPAVAATGTAFFMRQYLLANLSLELVDSARIDGSHEYITFNRIILPLMTPVLAVFAIGGFIGSWNSYTGPLILLTTPSMMTITVFISRFTATMYNPDYASAYMGIFVTIFPTIAGYLILSKYILAGLTLGAVKE